MIKVIEIIFNTMILAMTWLLSSVFATAGVGAANTLIPVYYSLGIPFSVSAAAGLLLNVFSLSSATVNNGLHHHINWTLGTTFLVPAVIMAPIGALVGINTPRKILLITFVIFLSYTLYNLVRTKKRNSRSVLIGKKGTLLGVTIGGVAGFLGGLLGVGGGMVILPVLTFMEHDYKKISGTAGFIALFSSASGFLAYLTILRGVDYALWAIILIGGILGGLTGSYLLNKVKSITIKYVIIAIVAGVTAKLIYSIVG